MQTSSRILIAEDDPLSASVLQQFLEDYECRIARNGREAWDAAQEENFDLMLLDVMMPEIDGLELCRRLRQQERTATTPIVMVTARAGSEDVVAGLAAGANDYVTKPIDGRVLQARVATQLRLVDLLRERHELTTMMTHDLKTPLSLILSANAHLRMEILRGRGTEENCARFLDIIRNNVGRMTGMINNYLSLSRLQGGRFPLRRAWFDPQRIADRLYDDASALTRPKGIRLAFECSGLPDEIHADEEALSRAANNLIGNAVKYTPEGGRIAVCLKADAERLAFTVEDSGPGLPADLLPRIFNRYERHESAKAEGTGIGLTIAKLVAEAHGGDVSGENRPEGGARFELWIPIGEAKPEGESRSG